MQKGNLVIGQEETRFCENLHERKIDHSTEAMPRPETLCTYINLFKCSKQKELNSLCIVKF